ncbi:uncharacterized protein LOC135399649 isoform X2 [Ornithodoros turicata]|uniref:uncharacterized protein LOC135399649 isoform X2 n=1 Tax=Ornithodoros turicata TaxID=34597 RepID=UPI0031396C4F
MLARMREDPIDQLICETLERRIEQQQRQLLRPRVSQQQTTHPQSPASVYGNMNRPSLMQQMRQSVPRQAIQATQVGSPLRVEVDQQGQLQTLQRTLHPQQQIAFSVGQVADQRVAQQIVQRPILQPVGHSVMQEPGPPVQHFSVQQCTQPLGQVIRQLLSEPVIQIVGQQAAQYIYEPSNQYTVQPPQLCMNQTVAQQVGGLVHQPMGQVGEPVCRLADGGFCVRCTFSSASYEKITAGPHKMQQHPLIDQHMVETLQVNNQVMPVYSLEHQLAGREVSQAADQQPTINIGKDAFFIRTGMQEQLLQGYLVERKKKKQSKKEESKAERKQSSSMLPMAERHFEEAAITIERFKGLAPTKLCTSSESAGGERRQSPTPDDDLQYRGNSPIGNPKRERAPGRAGCACRPFTFGSHAPSTDPSKPAATRSKQYSREIQSSPPRLTTSRIDDTGGLGDQIIYRRLSQNPGQQENELNNHLRLSMVPAQPQDQPIKARRLSQAPTQLTGNVMLCQDCKCDSIRVSDSQRNDIDEPGLKASISMARMTDLHRQTSQPEGNQGNGVDVQKQPQDIGLYGCVFAEHKQDGVQNDSVPDQAGPAVQCPTSSCERLPGLGLVQERPLSPPAPEALPVSLPQTRAAPPAQAVRVRVPLSLKINDSVAKDDEVEDCFMSPVCVFFGGGAVLLILLIVVYIILFGGKTQYKRMDTFHILPTEPPQPSDYHGRMNTSGDTAI